MRYLLLVLLVGCAPTRTDPSDATCGSDEIVVDVPTSDGLTLVADLHAAAEPDRGALVLVHMIPPSNDRTGYVPVTRQTLRDAGWTVLNLDRRGAGDSDGEAEAAFQGDGGRLDVEAAVRFLTDPTRACAVDPDRIVLVGASNGTTSLLDYAAARDDALPAAAGQVWMSPGAYTENQHAIGDHVDALGTMLWLYPSDEPFSEVWRAAPPEAWDFVRIGEAHGTHMFDEEPLRSDALLEITGFLADL